MIKIVTDSSCDLPYEFIEKYKINIIPLKVIINNVTYKEDVDIKKEEFYNRIKNGDIPTTAQITPIEFEENFKKMTMDNNDDIIAILFSSELSGTYQSAVIAKNNLNNDKIHVVDSRSATIGHGLVVLYAAQMVEQGYKVDKILKKLDLYINNLNSLLFFDDLNFIKRGGRLTGTQAAVGTILSIKPLFRIVDGKIVLKDKLMGRKKVISKMLEIIKSEADEEYVMGICHTNAEPYVNELIDEIKNKLNIKNIIVVVAGSVIGSHGGPGAIGVFYQKK